MIDLHLHSSLSDGTDPPGRIAELAAAAGCRALALTDHDTLEGTAEVARRAGELGLTAVPGCELSCSFGGRGAHVLVYWVDPDDSDLGAELVRLRADRVDRNRALVARLGELGMPISYDEVVAEAHTETSVGRPHVAAVLVRHGAASSIPDAFDRWLARGRPAHVPKARLAMADACALARGAGGVAVLAHPLTLGLSGRQLDAAVAELAAAGFAGLEARYARYDRHQRAALVRLAQRHGLVATGGSDYHGTVKAGLAVGVGLGDLAVPDETLDALAARRAG